MDAHLRDLRYFAAVAGELSFTRAAQRLHLSQPALSKQIRGLEAALRARLFDRDRRGVQLTATGEALLDVAQRVLAEWDAGLSAVAAAAAAEQRLLRIGTLTSIGRGLFPQVSDRFAERQPGWRIELHSYGWGDPTAGLRDRDSDAAFLWLPVDSDDIDHEVLVSEQRYVALNADHRLAGRADIRFSDLADEPFGALPASAGPLRDFWLGAEEGKPATVRVGAEFTTADEAFEIVSSGAAVTLLAEGNAVVYARPGIVCIPVTDLGPARLAVAWRRDDRRAAVHAFLRACREASGSTGDDDPLNRDPPMPGT